MDFFREFESIFEGKIENMQCSGARSSNEITKL